MIWLSLAFNYAGLVVFVLAMEAHRGIGLPLVPVTLRPGLRIVGTVLQAVALTLAIVTGGAALGVVEWIVGWAVCGLLLTLVLAFRPRAWPLPVVALSLAAGFTLIF